MSDQVIADTVMAVRQVLIAYGAIDVKVLAVQDDGRIHGD